MTEAIRKEIYTHFADLLSYPRGQTRELADLCCEKMHERAPDAARTLKRFAAFARDSEPSRVEETYTATFDLQPLCHPYVGYQLCGESQKRALFLMKLQQLYRQSGFRSGPELPDHLSEIMRFVGTVDNPDRCRELIDDGVRPALDKITAALDNDDHAYKQVLEALMMFLRTTGEDKGELS